MNHALMLLPAVLLIVLAPALCPATALSRSVWNPVGRLVDCAPFPVLLLNSILRSPLHPAHQPSAAAGLAAALRLGAE